MKKFHQKWPYGTKAYANIFFVQYLRSNNGKHYAFMFLICFNFSINMRRINQTILLCVQILNRLKRNVNNALYSHFLSNNNNE